MNKPNIILIMLILFSTSISFAQDLEKHRWKERVVLVLSQTTKSKLFNKQVVVLDNDKKGLKERKIIIYRVLPENYQITHNNWIINNKIFNKFKKTDKDFEIVLIGLDGGVKLRQTEILTKEKLFTLIDGMPIRRSELRERKNKG